MSNPTNPALVNPALVGPGTQPLEEDGSALDYMEMPEGMMTFVRPAVPEPEEAVGVEAAKAVLEDVLLALRAFKPGKLASSFDLGRLDAANLAFIDQVLGSGEVSIVAGADVQIQESVMAGIWRVRRTGADGRLVADMVEVGHVPAGLPELASLGTQPMVPPSAGEAPAGVQGAPALLSEINDNLRHGARDDGVYTINLSLLPHTEADLEYLAARLGQGSVIVLSRGYGNCRVSSTGTRHVWWVQYYNSQDALILNTLEITEMPEVACAAKEDIEDSAERLDEILEIYR